MNVISIDPKAKQRDERKLAMLEVLEELKRQVEEGVIEEFVACSMNVEGEAQIHASCLDVAGGVGMFEIGKHLLIRHELD
jgi:hypothetical protein